MISKLLNAFYDRIITDIINNFEFNLDMYEDDRLGFIPNYTINYNFNVSIIDKNIVEFINLSDIKFDTDNFVIVDKIKDGDEFINSGAIFYKNSNGKYRRTNVNNNCDLIKIKLSFTRAIFNKICNIYINKYGNEPIIIKKVSNDYFPYNNYDEWVSNNLSEYLSAFLDEFKKHNNTLTNNNFMQFSYLQIILQLTLLIDYLISFLKVYDLPGENVYLQADIKSYINFIHTHTSKYDQVNKTKRNLQETYNLINDNYKINVYNLNLQKINITKNDIDETYYVWSDEYKDYSKGYKEYYTVYYKSEFHVT
jgi:hypothetical protein